jgi:hypothetical protein
LRSEIRQTQIGALTVLDFHMSALEGIRTPELIRKSDPDMLKIDLGLRGTGRYEQDDRQNLLAPGEFHLADLSRPSRVAIKGSQEISVIKFPRAMLPVREKTSRNSPQSGSSPMIPTHHSFPRWDEN